MGNLLEGVGRADGPAGMEWQTSRGPISPGERVGDARGRAGDAPTGG